MDIDIPQKANVVEAKERKSQEKGQVLRGLRGAGGFDL